jgi:hypothetical protein
LEREWPQIFDTKIKSKPLELFLTLPNENMKFGLGCEISGQDTKPAFMMYIAIHGNNTQEPIPRL